MGGIEPTRAYIHELLRSGAEAAAAEMNMAVRLVGSATLVDEKVDVRVGPALVDRHHPLAAVEGARDDSVEACAADLFSRFPDVRVLRLSVSPQGAGPA